MVPVTTAVNGPHANAPSNENVNERADGQPPRTLPCSIDTCVTVEVGADDHVAAKIHAWLARHGWQRSLPPRCGMFPPCQGRTDALRAASSPLSPPNLNSRSARLRVTLPPKKNWLRPPWL